MEFFEKAHVVKNSNSSHKESKSEDHVKKQLKQMLYGYKQHNNDLIKRSGNVNTDDEDSSSVSGYSDLNITNSSAEADTTQDTVNSDENDISLSDFNDLNLHSNTKITKNDSENDSLTISLESTSGSKENDQSLSEGNFSDPQTNSISDSESVDTTEVDFMSGSEAHSDFDADGSLAARILDKLNKTEKSPKASKKFKKAKKRKISEEHSSEDEILRDAAIYKGPYNPNKEIEKDEVDAGNLFPTFQDLQVPANFQNLKKKEPKTKRVPKVLLPKTNDESMDEDQNSLSLEEDSVEYSSEINESEIDLSSPYVSVTATDMPSQTLEELVGDYKHSTMKNLPSDRQNLVCFTGNSGHFTEEDLNVSRIQIDSEDIDSLIPEVDDDVTVEDLVELDPSTAPVDCETDLDSSTQQLYVTALEASSEQENESTMYDTLESTQTEREASTESTEPFVNPVRVYYSKKTCIFVMKHPTVLYIHGKVRAKCLGGTVEALGYTFKDDMYEIYAPNYNYSQYLKTIQNQNAYYGLFGKLTASGLKTSEAEEIVTSIGDNDAVVRLQGLKSRKLDFVENNFSVADLFSKQTKYVENCFKKASELLGCSLYLTKPWKCFSEPSIWKHVIKNATDQQSRGIICGGKGAGKSTFLHYYINKLLANGPVVLIDLDPGQCELTVAGNISASVVTEPMLGPNFTHLKQPDMTLNLAMINPMDNTHRYANAVKTLFEFCWNNERYSNLPWIINTMGLCNTMGLKFMCLIVQLVKPTFLFQIDSKNAKKRFECHLSSYNVQQLCSNEYKHDSIFKNIEETKELDYQFFVSHHSEGDVKNYSLAPRDQRYLNFLAYFGDMLDANNESLLGIIPYKVNLKDLSVGANVNIKEEDLAKVINGKVVALCQHVADRRLFTLRDKPVRCYGHGLIRGIDWDNGVLYVITGMGEASLSPVNCVVYADWAAELRGPERGLPRGALVPYRTAAPYHQRKLTAAPRRRFNPIQLLKMSRNA